MSVQWVTRDAGTPIVWWGVESGNYTWHAVGLYSTFSRHGELPASFARCAYTALGTIYFPAAEQDSMTKHQARAV